MKERDIDRERWKGICKPPHMETAVKGEENYPSVGITYYIIYTIQLLFDRLVRCLKLFVSTDTTCHEVA